MNNEQKQPTANFAFQSVTFGNKAHQELLKGAEILANAVKSTIGPSGHSVIIDLGTRKTPLITKDGVTVARSINLKEKLPSMGAELLKEVATKTNELAGDGTTTATVLGYSILKKGIQMIATGRSSIELKKGMDIATDLVLQFLENKSIPVSCIDDIINVATISANGDKELGELIATAIDKVGKDGIVTIEPAKSVKTTLNVVEGLQIDNGYSSPFFITNSDKATCVLENPYVLVTNNKISSLNDLLPVLNVVHEADKPLLIIADEVEGEALHTLIVNKTKGIIEVCVVKAPSYGEFRADLLDDISTVVGSETIGATSSVSLSSLKKSHLGTCSKVIVSRTNCVIVADNTKDEQKNKIKKRIEDLRSVLETDTTLDALRLVKLRQRLAKLSGGVAVIHVGGSTEVEIKEKKDRVEDAVNATIAASQEGIVPGGGAALFYASQFLKNHIKLGSFNELSEDQIAGISVIAETCEAPFRTIVENTEYSPDVASQELISKFKQTSITKIKLDSSKEKYIQWSLPDDLVIEQTDKIIDTLFRFGFNAANGKYTDLIAEGIIDPVKVTRYALQHANSVIGLMLVCNACIYNEED
jgi:chaperonin GroEL